MQFITLMSKCLQSACRLPATPLSLHGAWSKSACRVLAECLQSACRVLAECLQSACRVLAECLQSACRVLAECLHCTGRGLRLLYSTRTTLESAAGKYSRTSNQILLLEYAKSA